MAFAPARWLDRVGVRPPMQIAIGLVVLVACVLQFAKALQLLPSKDESQLHERALLAQMTSSRIAYQLGDDDFAGTCQFLRDTLGTHGDIVSIGLRRPNGTIVFQTRGHEKNWLGASAHVSTPTHVQIQLFSNKSVWGRLEIVFKPLHPPVSWHNWWQEADVRVEFFILAGSLLLFWLFLSRMLRMLDPSAAVPQRMQLMMDTLVEGMVILDDEDRIVMANQAFARMTYLPMDRLIGHTLSSLPWLANEGSGAPASFPWRTVKETNLPECGVPLRLQIGTRHDHRLNVNASPILDPNGTRRGVLATFDDQTIIESDNQQLNSLISQFTQLGDDIRQLKERLTLDNDLPHLQKLDELAETARAIAEQSHFGIEEPTYTSVGAGQLHRTKCK